MLKHVDMGLTDSCQMWHVEASVEFLETSLLVSEVAAFAIGAHFLPVELTTILRLVFFVERSLSDPVDLSKFAKAMGILTLETIPAEAGLSPILAQFSLVLLGVQLHNLTVYDAVTRLRTILMGS